MSRDFAIGVLVGLLLALLYHDLRQPPPPRNVSKLDKPLRRVS